jgi:hypothetical protein
MIKTIGGVAALVFAFAAAAEAAPATPDEAQRLTTLFEDYVGHPAAGQPGAVSVVPHGDSYTASVDLSRLLGFLAAAGYTVTSSPLAAELTPQDDGRWHVVLDGPPIVGFTKGDQSFSMSVKGYTLDGVFDPKIQSFASATTTTSGSTTHGSGPKGTMNVTMTEAATGTYAGTDAGGGTVDIKSSQSSKTLTYSLDSTMPGATPDAPPEKLAFSISASDLASALAVGGARITALNDLWAFFTTHHTKDTIVAAQPELKTKLHALLPLVTSAVGDMAFSNLAVTTDHGVFGAGHFAQHYEFGGPAARQGVLTTIKLSGLTLPGALVPAWAGPLVPTSLDFTQSYGPLNLTPALGAAIDEMDLGADKPLTDEQQAGIMQTLAQGDMNVTVAPSVISTALMTVKFEGEAHMTKPMPTGAATISVTGLDKTIDALRAGAPDAPEAAQAIGFLSAVKILAKAEGVDNYSWHVVAAPGAEITVNGNPLSAPAAASPAPVPAPKTRKKKANGPDQGHVTIPQP